MPIGGNSLAADDTLPANNEATPTGVVVNTPKIGTVLGVAIKNDTVEEPDALEPNNKQTENDDLNPENKDQVQTAIQA